MQTNIVAAPQPLEKDQWHCLMEGDIFSLMPGKYIYRVHVKEDDQTLRWFSLSLTGIHLLFSNNRAQSDWLCMNLYIYFTSLRKGLIYWCWMYLFKVNICTVCFFNTFKFGFILVWNTFFNLKWYLMDTMNEVLHCFLVECCHIMEVKLVANVSHWLQLQILMNILTLMNIQIN